MLTIIAICSGYVSAALIVIDYDDGIANSVHDSVLGNGEFTDSTASTSDGWTALIGTPEFNDSGSPDAPTGSAINYESRGGDVLGRSTGQTILAGDTAIIDMSFQWIRRQGFDNGDEVRMVVYTTVDNLIGGMDLETVILTSFGSDSGSNNGNAAWFEVSTSSGQSLAGDALLDKNVFVRLENAANSTNERARFDNIFVCLSGTVPEPSSTLFLMIGALTLFRRRRG